MEEQLGAGIVLAVGLLILAVFGGWLFQALGLTLGGGIVGAFVPALIGAVPILLIVKMLRHA